MSDHYQHSERFECWQLWTLHRSVRMLHNVAEIGHSLSILVPRAYDLFCQRWDRRALVSAITGCREIHLNPLRCYCACSVLVREALGMTILTTNEKFEFLSIELWCFMDRLKDVRDPLNKNWSFKRSCLSCRSCSEERLSLHFAHGFWICILPD